MEIKDQKKPVAIFCCYARKDQPLLDDLKAHLMPLHWQGLITLWADTDIDAGSEWEEEIEKHLNTSQVILLLVSSNFMNSDYCYSKEMQRAMERHNRGEARVIPIILLPIYWQGAPFGKLQALPKDGEPVVSPRWHTKDEALADVVKGLLGVITTVTSKSRTEQSPFHVPTKESHSQDGDADQEIEPNPLPLPEKPPGSLNQVGTSPDSGATLLHINGLLSSKPTVPPPLTLLWPLAKRRMKRKAIIVSFLLILLLLGVMVTGTVWRSWPNSTLTYDQYVKTHGMMFGFGPQHTHENPFERQLNPGSVSRLVQQWVFPTGSWIGSSPAVTGKVVYVSSGDHKLYALDTATGIEKWEFATRDIVSSSPAVAEGMVYVGSRDHKLYALDTATGTKKWEFPTGNWIRSSPAVAGKVVYIGSDDGKLYALDAATGTKKWEFFAGDTAEPSPSLIVSSPTVVGGVVYVGSRDHKLYALDAATGTKKWEFLTGDAVRSSPAVAGGVVYIGSDDGKLYALDAASGIKKWEFPIGYWVRSSPMVAGGVVYIGSGGSRLYALDAATGTRKRDFPTRDIIVSSPAVAEGMVYVGSDDHNLYAFALPGTPH